MVHIPMKIVIVNFTDLTTGAGTETVTLNLTRAFKKSEVDLTVVDTDWVFNNTSFISLEKVKKYTDGVRCIKIHDYFHKFDFLNRNSILGKLNIYFVRPLVAYILGHSVYRSLFRELSESDIVYLMNNLYALAFPRRNSIIVASNQCWIPNKLNNFLNLLLPLSWLRRVDAFHLFAPVDQEIIMNKPTISLPNGVDTTLFVPKVQATHKNIKFLFASRLDKGKGLEQVLEVWKRIHNRELAELNIVGGGPLDYLAKDFKGENYSFKGPMNPDDLAGLYAESDVFLYPTNADTFSLAVTQAFSSGLYCIIGEQLRGLFDPLVNVGYGRYVDPEDVEGIALMVDKLIERGLDSLPDKRHIYELTKKTYDWVSIANEMRLQFELLIQRKRSTKQ